VRPAGFVAGAGLCPAGGASPTLGDEIVQKVERHVAESHPELVGKMSRDDVLGMAEEE
jgi:hypothetical protein